MSRVLIHLNRNSFSRRTFVSEPFVDHYAVLGLHPGASLKEIKEAYYNLSKQYHPDRNRDNKEEAAAKFLQVSLAYEILGSDEKRRIYDMTRIRTSSDLSSSTRQNSTFSPTKEYTDIDIDYKSLEHFQRQTRRRKQFHSRFNMPEEFYAEFGGKKPVYESEYDPLKVFVHKDSRTQQREKEEFIRQIQLEQERQQMKYPIPTFEQLLREKRKKEQEENRKHAIGVLMFATVGLALYLISRTIR
ncbi:DnaJ domain protein [Dictyocaulus viviparus]|uniref:DnaJ domain protein n=1 Tax=Dictyocaulus viviparus TaxID=29172 RepID=A0A0D8XK33_DICVI|nr:DnaJ domain protein [Dictyocaulus viviparus]